MGDVRISVVVAARPNLPKAWALLRGLGEHPVEVQLVHAGQHYDPALRDGLLADLGLPDPDVQLTTGSGTHAEQLAAVAVAIEPVLVDSPPDAVVVIGDVNATLATTIVAARTTALVVHLEAGLRSRDRTMPEEQNRVATDHLCDLLLAPSADAVTNLEAEGLASRTVLVGNTMVDALDAHLELARRRRSAVPSDVGDRFGLVTLHRPSNVDVPDVLERLLDRLAALSHDLPLVLPAHPRARARFSAHALPPGVHLGEPLGYLDFLAALDRAAVVLTDSGGVQEESTVLGVPCLTLRTTTERPVTVELGTNRLVAPDDPALAEIALAAAGEPRRAARPEGWDGGAGHRAATAIIEALGGTPTGRVRGVGRMSGTATAP